MDYNYRALVAAAIKKMGSGRKLAKYLGITPGAVSMLLNGKNKPSADHVIAMLRLTGKLMLAVSLSALLTSSPTAHAATGSTSERLYIMLNRFYALLRRHNHLLRPV